MSNQSHTNRLYYGDCLTVMRGMRPGSIDLIYLDPPFNSARSYNAIYKDETGRPLPDQIEAFCDTWQLDEERARAIRGLPVLMRQGGISDEATEFWRLMMNALERTQPTMLAYLSYMAERLLAMKPLLKKTGSVYLHCDPTASHYIKVMMDTIFGHNNYRNEIIWGYRTGGVSKNYWPRKHDVLLVYGATETAKKVTTHNPLQERIYYDVNFMGTCKWDDARKKWYADVYVRDVWDDDTIKAVLNMSSERMGYATQKPVALLERIIGTSSKKGDVVFDPFCGCATTIEAAHKLNRGWIGIDIAIHAVKRVSSVRLKDRLGLVEGKDYFIEGIPLSVEGARDLWERDKYHFQKWAVEQVDGFVTDRRTADGGIDGRLYFTMSGKGGDYLSSMVLEVKGGGVGIGDVRGLRGVLERDDAAMAGLIVMEPLGDRQAANFHREMAQAGDIEVNGVKYARMQMLSVAEILEGRRFDTPSRVAGRGEKQPVLPGSTTTKSS
ncbi:MAG: site-specific DNA-methyltransferase [Alphaproteobacteria bacterium]|nr:site-specific DNA-methyltransferase [Alphaproteobacteria bacterium]MDA7988808.1 site-specific DNA-methyltransferase [Alphaproteobacteria bacterium]MDA8008916.1 site-specific DNA-methyltransferase [Alphaproteobacteria bacterium]